MVYTTIDEYIAQCPETYHPLLQSVRETIRAAAPDATEKISWQMPTFYQNGNLIHFALQKKHIGIYPGSSGVEHFAEKLKDYQTSKGTIQFPLDKPIPHALIAEITRFRVEENTRK